MEGTHYQIPERSTTHALSAVFQAGHPGLIPVARPFHQRNSGLSRSGKGAACGPRSQAGLGGLVNSRVPDLNLRCFMQVPREGSSGLDGEKLAKFGAISSSC